MDNTCCTSNNSPQTPTNNSSHTKNQQKQIIGMFLPALFSFILLILGIYFDQYNTPSWFSSWVRIIWYTIAYLPVGLPVIKEAYNSMWQKDFFSEFFLMSLATLGAFAISEFPEGVAVMLFYTVGENFQSLAVAKAKKNIKNLLDQRPDEVTIVTPNEPQL